MSFFFSAFKDGILKVCLDEQFTFPHACDTLLSRKIENKTYVFGLTSHYRLFMNDKEVLTNFVVIMKYIHKFTRHLYTIITYCQLQNENCFIRQ